MLLRFVAIVATLAMLFGLTGVVVDAAVRNEHPAVVEAGGYSVAAQGLPTLSATHPRSSVEGLHGVEFLEQLVLLDEVSLAEVAAERGPALLALVKEPVSADSVARWWVNVEPAQRHALVRAIPGTIGNLQGVPFEVRDVANRRYLHQSIEAVSARLSDARGRSATGAASAQLEMLLQIEEALGDAATTPRRALVLVDVEPPGRAAVALGDLSTADYVSYLVPGMFFTVTGQIVDWTQTAAALHSDQMSVVHESAVHLAAHRTARPSTFATVAWMGYETPNIFTVAGLDLAHDGADRLAATVDGLRAVRRNNPPYISLLTHSYGSTAATIALSSGSTAVDALAIVGSPGVMVDRASQLAVARGKVFVGEASWDPVVDTAFHGFDPGAQSFGAQRIGVGGRVDLVTGTALTASTGHNGYFAPGTESLRNLALIALDRADLLSDGDRSVLATGR